jgi:hypothetical protein
MKEERNKHDRPESYPKPTETDQQLKNQPEYIDQEPNTYNKEISDVPQQEDNEEPKVTRVTDGGASGR